jgi:hypothetical protein
MQRLLGTPPIDAQNPANPNESGSDVNWTKILAEAGIPEPPGYRETFDKMLLKQQARREAQLEETRAKLRPGPPPKPRKRRRP